jgi:hypothetical protein
MKRARGGKRSGKIEFALGVCSAVKDGKPDLYNAPPKRVVTVEEARAHGWPHFYDGITKCPQGHIAARYTSNEYRCVDCARITDGKLPIYSEERNDDLISNAVTQKEYQDPSLNTNFKWSDESFRLFCVAYTNTGDVEKSLRLVHALPYDLITELRANAARAADFESTRRDVDQVFLWKAEGSAATGSDRAMLARAGASFPDRFGSRAQNGLDTQPYVNPDKACAELAHLVSSLAESFAQQDALGAPSGPRKSVETAHPGPATGPNADLEEDVLLGPAHDNSDLVSDE